MEYRANTIIPDDQLLQYFLSNDPTALETLVYLNKDKIYQSIFSVVQDKQQADEIFKDVFIRIINSLMAGKSMEDGKFLPWAMTLANNMCIDYLRKAKYAPLLKEKNNEQHTMAMYIQPEIGNIMNHEQHDEIRRMINMLPDEEREVIVLRHYADLSFKEIADIMKCTINIALSRMRYALTDLHRIMQEKQLMVNA